MWQAIYLYLYKAWVDFYYSKNIISIIYLYPLYITALESFGGQRLLQKGDINIGTHANTMFRIKACEEPSIDLHKSKDNRHTTYLGMFISSML